MNSKIALVGVSISLELVAAVNAPVMGLFG
jgi:hypothetical protein